MAERIVAVDASQKRRPIVLSYSWSSKAVFKMYLPAGKEKRNWCPGGACSVATTRLFV